jgi:hypothetical protein
MMDIAFEESVVVTNYCCPVKNKLVYKFMMDAAFEGCKVYISF